MDRARIAAAVSEAKRFIACAEALPGPTEHGHAGHTWVQYYFPREQGAIRRSSMDLTRALADMRRPG